MNRCAALAALTLSVLLTGCVTSRSLGTLDKKARDDAGRLEALRLLENSDPDKALSGYRLYLTAEAQFNKPLLYYQHQLDMQLRQMRTSRAQVLGENVLAAFPPFYHRRLEGLVSARLGSARVHLAQGDLAGALTLVKQALQLVERRSRSAVYTARMGRATAELAVKVHGAREDAARAALSRFRARLYQDFLESDYAREQSSLREQDLEEITERIAEIDRFVAKVNRKRTVAAAAELASAVAQTAGGVSLGGTASHAANAASAAVDAGATVLDLRLQFASIPQAAGSLTPASDLLLIEQLWDPKKGKDPAHIVRDFIGEAQALAGGSARPQAAQLLLALNKLLALRERHDESQAASAAGEFLLALAALQKRLTAP